MAVGQGLNKRKEEATVKRLFVLATIVLLGLLDSAPAQAYIIMQNNSCSSTFGTPSCSLDPGKTCCYDATGCRSATCGNPGWDECEDHHCPEYEMP